eukprot:m.1267907 g.1267907  ORF g.1267907 m.1267907 type:complete len:303 (+) comp24743_c0_seq21:1661-2569(+)
MCSSWSPKRPCASVVNTTPTAAPPVQRTVITAVPSACTVSLTVAVTVTSGRTRAVGGASSMKFDETTAGDAPPATVTLISRATLVGSAGKSMENHTASCCPPISRTCTSRSGCETPDVKGKVLTETVPLKSYTPSFFTTQLGWSVPPLQRAQHVANTSVYTVLRRRYCNGFHRPPMTCPSTDGAPYSMLPQPPHGHISLYCHVKSPHRLLVRQPSTSALTKRACPTMLWYSCFFSASSPVWFRSCAVPVHDVTHPHIERKNMRHMQATHQSQTSGGLHSSASDSTSTVRMACISASIVTSTA